MKIKGKKLDSPVIETVVIPRQDGNLVFKARAVKSYEDFEKLCPRPVPPTIIKANGQQLSDVEDEKYKADLNHWAECRTCYMIIKSLEATEGLEWETVIPNESSTWANYAKELEESNLSQPEIGRIISICIAANGLDQTKIDKATESFLAGPAEQASKQ